MAADAFLGPLLFFGASGADVLELAGSAAPGKSPGVFVGGLLPTTAANVISTIGCAWLLNRIQSLPSPARRRLFPRQLRWLAVSDIIFHLASTFDNIVGFASIGFGTSTGNSLCVWSSHLLRLGTNMSMCVEMHIAVSFAAQCFRWRFLLAIWPNLLRGVPVVALIFMVIEAIQAPASQDNTGWCTADHHDIISVYLMGSSFVVSSFAYMLTSVQACNAGEVVAARAWKRAMAYPLSFVLTQFVMVIIIFTPANYPKTSTMLVLGVTLQNLNGFANTMVYALQSRYATRFLQEKPVRAIPITVGEDYEPARERRLMEHSFPVQLGGVTIEEIIPASYASTLASASARGSGPGTNTNSEYVATFFEDAVARTQTVGSHGINSGGLHPAAPAEKSVERSISPVAEMPTRGLSAENAGPPRVGD